MNKIEIIVATGLIGLMSLVAVSAFAETTGISVENPTALTSPISQAKPTPAEVTAKIACVGTAVNAREQSLDSAMTTFTQVTNSAYSARAMALQQAYAQTTAITVRTAVKKAWSDFTATMKTGRKTWQTAKSSAWLKFGTAVRVCKVPASINASVTDNTMSSLEASGQ